MVFIKPTVQLLRDVTTTMTDSSGNRPPKKRAFKLVMEDNSSDDDDQPKNQEVISLRSSSEEESGASSDAASTLAGDSSPDYPHTMTMSQQSHVSVLATQEPGSEQKNEDPGSSKAKKGRFSTTPLDSLAATGIAGVPNNSAAATSAQIPTLKLTKATKENVKPKNSAASKPLKDIDDMTLGELSAARVSAKDKPKRARAPAKKKTPTKKKTPLKKPAALKDDTTKLHEAESTKGATSEPAFKATASTKPASKVVEEEVAPAPMVTKYSNKVNDATKSASPKVKPPTPAPAKTNKVSDLAASVKAYPPNMSAPIQPEAKPTATKKDRKRSASTKAATPDNASTYKKEKPAATTKNQDDRPADKEASSAAPPKKKKKMTYQDQVLSHMLLSFKPFTLKTLAEALKTTDTVLNHVMLSLVDKNVVLKKDFTSAKGRTKTLYWANHGSKAKEVTGAISSPEKIEETKRELEGLRQQHATLNSALTGLSSQLSNLELTQKLVEEETQLEALQRQVDEAKARIRSAKEPPKQQPKSLLARAAPPKSAALLARERCPHRMKIRINAMRKEWKDRKEKCLDFVEQLSDGLEKKPKDVIKMLEIETDEMVGSVMGPKKVIDL